MLLLANVLLCLGLVQTVQQAPKVENGFFDSNGVKIHYTVQGEGEPVLLIHGFTADIRVQWDSAGITKALAANYRVIALDNRGHGQSAKPHDPKKYGKEMAEDAIRLLDHLKIKKAHVIGYSMGAMIAGNLLANHPDRLLSLTLGGAGVLRPSSNMEFFDTLGDALAKDKSIAPLIEFLTPPGQPKPSAQEIKTINFMLMSINDVDALAAVVRSWKGLVVSDEALKANKVPVQGVVGDRDPLKQSLEELKGALPGLQIVIVPDGNHMDTFRKPAFVEALKEFLAKNASKKAAQ
jgi:pimeloyl-ACP methyl ester carboxylesterase